MSLPTVTDELNRKSLDAATKLLSELQSDTISYREFYYGMRSIWDTASGLIEGDLMDMIAGFLQDGPGTSVRTELFSNSGKLCAIRSMDEPCSVQLIASGPVGGQVSLVNRLWSSGEVMNPKFEADNFRKVLKRQLLESGAELI